MSSSSRYVADFNVAGMRYWDGAKVISKLKSGKRLRLVAEPHNPADPNAVAIYRKDAKLGYIPRDQNDLAAQLLRFGHGDVLECRILKVDKKGLFGGFCGRDSGIGPAQRAKTTIWN